MAKVAVFICVVGAGLCALAAFVINDDEGTRVLLLYSILAFLAAILICLFKIVWG